MYVIDELIVVRPLENFKQLRITPGISIPYVAEDTALSKKEAQSKAAWKMADYMIKNKLVVEQELPPRPDVRCIRYKSCVKKYSKISLN